ncbi:hypothetical protein [Methylocystis sp. B8]|uniref:hypothetical protein n=1 Tax=Methylocystis sp. B8 TaxID=544938 RepID=UPI0012744B78|nr:hypothetical protein [Methylocystis sp. B8]TLG77816.1 hypothetical protein FEV16_08330 [Methylocystis sp. B8]
MAASVPNNVSATPNALASHALPRTKFEILSIFQTPKIFKQAIRSIFQRETFVNSSARRYSGVYIGAEQEAKNNRRGIWAGYTQAPGIGEKIVAAAQRIAPR